MSSYTCYSVRQSGSITVVDVFSNRAGRWPAWRMYLPTKSSVLRLRRLYRKYPKSFYIYKGPFSAARVRAIAEIARNRRPASLDPLSTSDKPSTKVIQYESA